MKALFVAHCNDLSGANKSFFGIIENLKTKMEIVVLVNKKEGQLTDKLNELGIEVICCKYGWWYSNNSKNFIKKVYRTINGYIKYKLNKPRKKFLRYLKNMNFDVIYTNTSTVEVGAKIAAFINVPHVWHVREFGYEDFGFISLTSKKYKEKVLNSSEKIILISEALKNKYSKFVDSEKLTRVYNGLQIENHVYPLGEHDLSKKIQIIITGQVCEGKGQAQAIEACAKLYEKGYPICLNVAGMIDYSYLNPILKLYPSHEKWLKILGQVDNLFDIRKDMDIELICSRSEAFGRVTIEAMLHSIPVIGSNTGGTPELIKDEVTGLLFEHGNIKQLSECIIKLINNPELYNKIVANAFEYASSFTIEATANSVEKILMDVGANNNNE